VSRLSNADWSVIREERSRARPTPWRVLAERFAVTEADLRAALATPDPAPPANDDKPDRALTSYGVDLDAFKTEWAKGRSVASIARAMRIGNIKAVQIVHALGLPVRRPGSPGRWRPEHEARMRQMMGDGHTSNEIGRTLGFAGNTIRAKADALGLTFSRGRAR
jgi:hypothetical protein